MDDGPPHECRNCGTAHDRVYDDCPNCGTGFFMPPVSDDPACAECGSPFERELYDCPECGRSFVSSA